ncbi:hypothetical protein [Rhodopirellula baltica]|nr:hypothetical protein [Rhodopirellula baltica]
MAIPDDIARKLTADFDTESANIALQALADLQAVSDDFTPRVLRCITYASFGDFDHFNRLLAMARSDPRDVMREAEFDINDKRLRDLSIPFDL